VLESFFTGCVSAGLRGCAFFAPSPAAVSRKLDLLLQSLKEKPVPVQQGDFYGVVNYPMVKTSIFVCLYQPYGTFPILAKALADLEKGDGTRALQLATVLGLAGARRFQCPSCKTIRLGKPIPDTMFESQIATICTDGTVVPNSIDDARHYYENMANRSKWVEIWARIRLACLCVPGVLRRSIFSFFLHDLTEGGVFGRRITLQVC
jgi:hypothetical protein